MSRLTRLLRPVAAATLVGAGLVALPVASAEAATQCSGSQIDSGKSDSGYGTWRLYWNGSTKKNCVRMDATGRGVGRTKSMYLEIWACDSKKSSSCGKSVTDEGNYHTYAGPISISAPHCVQIYYANDVDDGGRTTDAGTVGPFHCS